MKKTKMVIDGQLAKQFNEMADELESRGVSHTICHNFRYIAKYGQTSFDGYDESNHHTVKIINDHFPQVIKGETIDGRFLNIVDIRVPEMTQLQKLKDTLKIGNKLALMYGSYKNMQINKIYYVVSVQPTGIIVNQNYAENWGTFVKYPKASDMLFDEDEYTYFLQIRKNDKVVAQFDILK